MIELVFFDEDRLLLNAVRSLLLRPGAATVRRVLMDWTVMDMEGAAESEMDAVLAFVNSHPDDRVWDRLRSAFPRLREAAHDAYEGLGIRPAPSRVAAEGHTVCVDAGRGPLVITYGPSEGGSAHAGFSAMLRLAPEHCTVGIPCLGNVFGTRTTAQHAIEGMMRALDDISIREPESLHELSGQDHADVSQVPYGILYYQGEVGLQPERAGCAQGAGLREERQELQ